MSGYCLDCGNTICLCDEIAEGVAKYGTADAVAYWRERAIRAEEEVTYLKASQWEPSEGIWRVERTANGRSSSLVAPLDLPEREAIVRAVLQMHADVAMRAIMGAYDRNKFCPTMLEHRDHDGFCGVWLSAHEMWTAVRDALAKELPDHG